MTDEPKAESKVEKTVERATAGLPLTGDERKEIAERIAKLEAREAVSASDVRKIVEQVLAERETTKADKAEVEEEEDW